jgi:hypothetical protein
MRASDVPLLAVASGLLVLARCSVQRDGLMVAMRRLDPVSRFLSRRALPPDAVILRVTSTVDLAADMLPGPVTCLPRSLVVGPLLARAGIQSTLRIGAHRSNGAFEAHSWVEVDGRPVTDDEAVIREFEPFADPVGPVVIRAMR